MPRGDKSSHTDKQKRKAEHIEEGYAYRGVSKDETERRAWAAAVNKQSGGGNKSGSHCRQGESHASSREDGQIGGSSQSAQKRSQSARMGSEVRGKNA